MLLTSARRYHLKAEKDRKHDMSSSSIYPDPSSFSLEECNAIICAITSLPETAVYSWLRSSSDCGLQPDPIHIFRCEPKPNGIYDNFPHQQVAAATDISMVSTVSSDFAVPYIPVASVVHCRLPWWCALPLQWILCIKVCNDPLIYLRWSFPTCPDGIV